MPAGVKLWVQTHKLKFWFILLMADTSRGRRRNAATRMLRDPRADRVKSGVVTNVRRGAQSRVWTRTDSQVSTRGRGGGRGLGLHESCGAALYTPYEASLISRCSPVSPGRQVLVTLQGADSFKGTVSRPPISLCDTRWRIFGVGQSYRLPGVNFRLIKDVAVPAYL